MRLRLATWNVNSVRLRAEQVVRFAREQDPDVLCLQEIKCREGEFPRAEFEAAGYPHMRISGQKGSHGVAIVSRLPLDDAPALDLCREGHARVVGARVSGIEVQNFYIPAGGDTPDPETNPKFAHKLDFFARLTAEARLRNPADALVITGDLNVAHRDSDLKNWKGNIGCAGCHPDERARFDHWIDTLGWVDVARTVAGSDAVPFTWWSFRGRAFDTDAGWRIDYQIATPEFAARAAEARVDRAPSYAERWSDHAPMVATYHL